MSDSSKNARYDEARQQIAGLVAESKDPIAAMASTTSVLFEQIKAASWVGFYRVVGPGLLRVGPYQGPVGCLEIPFDRGVCGAAASQQRTQIVPDVHAFPGHIACDSKARSEIVLPILDLEQNLVAVLDIDSHEVGAFDEADRLHLERIAKLLEPCFSSPGST